MLGSFWGQLLLAMVVFGLIVSFVAKPYTVSSSSMEPTLKAGDQILVDRVSYRFGEPTGGDVAVFDAGPTWDEETPRSHRCARSGSGSGSGRASDPPARTPW